MRRGLERRLERLARAVRRWADAAEHERCRLAAREKIAALIRAGLERAGLDPAEAVALRRYEAPAPLPQPAAIPFAPDPREAFFARLRTLAERMRGDPPDLAAAPPVALLAYCLFGDGAREAPA